ncbi:MAG: sortase [Patescibacteria group bacterium]
MPAFLKNNNFISLFLIFIGVTLIGFVFVWRIQQRILSFNSQPANAQQVEAKNIPGRITIPKIKLSLPIETSTIENKVWQISDTRVSFLDISAGLGQGGNTVLYGHNKQSIFGPIRWLKVGDEIGVTDQEGKEHRYIIDKTVTVNPDNISFVEPKTKETLTIYTCIGLFDSKRFIIVAYPVNP